MKPSGGAAFTAQLVDGFLQDELGAFRARSWQRATPSKRSAASGAITAPAQRHERFMIFPPTTG